MYATTDWIMQAKGVLKDIVIVVSLVRTLTESFGSAGDLYRKLKRKSKSKSSSSDEEEERKPRRRPSRKRRDSSSDAEKDRGRHRHLRWKLNPKDEEFSDSDEELIVTSSSRIREEYDRGYRKLGEAFARGDCTYLLSDVATTSKLTYAVMTQIQLQSQIIELQRTLLAIHQDYMLSTYLSPSSSHSHLARLIQTTRAARQASINALHMQYQRLLLSDQPNQADPQPTIPGAFPLPPIKAPRNDSVVRKPHSRPRHRSRSNSPDPCSDDKEYHIQPFPNPPPAPHPPPTPKKLFCVYAKDLQDHARLPLTDNYKSGGDNLCPYCHAHIAVRPGKAWEIVTNDCEGGVDNRRVFLVRSRFLVKSHREGSGFACVLCARYRRSDTVCKEVDTLMEHLWKDHTGEEMEKDDDIVELDD